MLTIEVSDDFVSRLIDFQAFGRVDATSLERLLTLARRAVQFEHATGILPDLGHEIPHNMRVGRECGCRLPHSSISPITLFVKMIPRST